MLVVCFWLLKLLLQLSEYSGFHVAAIMRYSISDRYIIIHEVANSTGGLTLLRIICVLLYYQNAGSALFEMC